MTEGNLKNPKMRDIATPLKPAINVALPQVAVPPPHEVRSQFLFEFPYVKKRLSTSP